jgi:hypothetical protein
MAMRKNVKHEVPDLMVGKSIDEAEKIAKAAGFRVRATIIDGESQMGTCDFCTDRINVSTQDGKIVKTHGIG